MIIWEPITIEKNRPYFWQIGTFKLWIKKIDDELLLSYEQSSEGEESQTLITAEPQEDTENLAWNRFVIKDESNVLQLVPALPERAVVVNSESPVKILPGNGALFFISIPIWVQVYAGEKKKTLISEIPTIVLSNTWFGDPMNGELCFSLSTRARRSIVDTHVPPSRAVCPVWIKNGSQTQLDLQKLCVHVEHLKTYKGKKQLWTNEVYVTFTGEDQLSQVTFSRKTPTIEEGCTLICKERIPVDQSLIQRSFSILKYFTNF